MSFNKSFSNLEGTHAPFSASQSSWLRYSDEKLISVYLNMKAKELGTKLHKWAQDTIELGIEQPDTQRTIYMYVNDVISYGMSTERMVGYSEHFYGTADALSFRNDELRIFDLKTGKTPAHMDQLLLYATYYCLENRIDPKKIRIELRIYQMDEIEIYEPDGEEIKDLMKKIKHFDKLLSNIDKEA